MTCLPSLASELTSAQVYFETFWQITNYSHRLNKKGWYACHHLLRNKLQQKSILKHSDKWLTTDICWIKNDDMLPSLASELTPAQVYFEAFWQTTYNWHWLHKKGWYACHHLLQHWIQQKFILKHSDKWLTNDICWIKKDDMLAITCFRIDFSKSLFWNIQTNDLQMTSVE